MPHPTDPFAHADDTARAVRRPGHVPKPASVVPVTGDGGRRAG
ncbi:hypothetical protein [Amycolatopsis sp. cg9]